MKFVSLIASTLLIVLIGQHCSTALPINESTTEEPCLEGFERVDGQCVEVTSELLADKVRKQSDASKKYGACPKGMVRSENGICEQAILNDQPAITVEPKEGHEEVLEVTDKPSHVTAKPLEATSEPLEATEKPSNITREPVAVTEESSDVTREPLKVTEEPSNVTSEPVEVTDEPSNVTSEPVKVTGKLSNVTREPLEVTEEPSNVTSEPLEVTEEPLDVTGEPLKVTEEPLDITSEPLEVTEEPLDVTGEPLKVTEEPLETTEEPLDVTDEPLEVTSENSEVEDDEDAKDTIRKSSSVEVPKGCPPGTKADGDGACQDIKQTSTKKTLTDLKVRLNKDGSCPENMKKINGRCMYVRSKFMAKIKQNFATINDDDLTASRTRVANGKNGEYQLVAVLPDNSCPNGTEYSDYGLCRKRIRPSSFIPVAVAKPECPKEHVFVGGRCIPKKIEVLLPSDVAAKVSKSSTTTPETEQSEDDESPKPTPKLTIVKETPVEA